MAARFSPTLSSVLFLLAVSVQAQEASYLLIEKRLEMIKNGQVDEVKAELPTLLTRYQNDPGVLYLEGILTSDGAEAVKVFQSVVENFPESEWADDALYKIYQYSFSLGLYKTAAQTYERLKREYPGSPYLAPIESRTAFRGTDEGERVKSSGGSDRTSFAVQVGAFSTLENANKQKKYFQNIGQPIDILNKVKGGRSFYLVWVGNFKSYEDARKFGSDLRARYKIEPLVVER
jgi:tetratricopeptide (TPR) repeat protein